jgi:hypothetical protein
VSQGCRLRRRTADSARIWRAHGVAERASLLSRRLPSSSAASASLCPPTASWCGGAGPACKALSIPECWPLLARARRWPFWFRNARRCLHELMGWASATATSTEGPVHSNTTLSLLCMMPSEPALCQCDAPHCTVELSDTLSLSGSILRWVQSGLAGNAAEPARNLRGPGAGCRRRWSCARRRPPCRAAPRGRWPTAPPWPAPTSGSPSSCRRAPGSCTQRHAPSAMQGV